MVSSTKVYLLLPKIASQVEIAQNRINGEVARSRLWFSIEILSTWESSAVRGNRMLKKIPNILEVALGIVPDARTLFFCLFASSVCPWYEYQV